MNNAKQRTEAKLQRWAWASIALNVILAGLHTFIAVASGSLAVTAELVHNVVDLLTAVAVLIGLKLSIRTTKTFPYGLHKVENIVATVLALMIFFTAYEIVRSAFFAPPVAVDVRPWMLAVVALTMFLPLAFSHFELRVAQKANSPSLGADAREYRVHALTTGLVFAALIAEWLRFPIDRIVALVIVVAIVKTGWELLRDAMRVLLDAALEPDVLSEVKDVVDRDRAVVNVNWVTGRSAGRYRFVETGVSLRSIDTVQVENAIRRIEASVRKAVPYVERVLVHVETLNSPSIRFAVPLADAGGSLSRHFGQAPYFALLSIHRDTGATEEQRIVSNPNCAVEKAKGIRVAEWLLEHKIDVVVTHEDLTGKGPAFVLGEAGVEIRNTDKSMLHDLELI